MKAKTILQTAMDLCEVIMKNGRLVVFICHDSSKIWGFRYGRALGIGTHLFGQGRFFRACSLPRERFLLGEATQRRNRTPTEKSGRFDEIEYLDD
jgi:hypothetical protein